MCKWTYYFSQSIRISEIYKLNIGQCIQREPNTREVTVVYDCAQSRDRKRFNPLASPEFDQFVFQKLHEIFLEKWVWVGRALHKAFQERMTFYRMSYPCKLFSCLKKIL